MGCLLVIVWLVCFVILAGWFYPDIQGYRVGDENEVNREHLGYTFLVSGFFALLGPLGLIIGLCMTGFAQHGWYLPYRRLWRK